MGNGVAGLLGRAQQPADLSAYTRFGGAPQSYQRYGGLPMSLTNSIQGLLAAQGTGQQIPTQQPQQPFPTYGQYGLLAAQMAQRPQQPMLMPGGMPPSGIPYRPWGK